ncbi:MAG: type III polyketide synthase, partial [Bacteroidetes bacterium]
MTYLVATGTAVPAHRYAQAELAAFMIEAHGFSGQRAARSLRLLYEKTRIRYRHSVLPDFGPNGKKELFEAGALPLVEDRMHIYQREVLPLALSAAQQCVAHFHQQQGPLDLQEITHLITVSCTGQHAPGLEITLAEA